MYDVKISYSGGVSVDLWRKMTWVHSWESVYGPSICRQFILRVMMWHTVHLGIVFPVVHRWYFCCSGITRSGQRSTSTMFCRSTRRRSWVPIDLPTFFVSHCLADMRNNVHLKEFNECFTTLPVSSNTS